MRYTFRRIYRGPDAVRDNFYDVLPGELTLTPQKWYGDSQPVSKISTLFDEVQTHPYKPSSITRDMVSAVGHPKYRKDIRAVYESFKRIVERKWDPAKFHVVAHSAGVDSRILSYCILELAEKHGDQWLGEILFVENGGESDGFRKIMRLEGWDQSQYLVYNEDAAPHDYNEYGLTFDMMVRKYNGACGFPINCFYDCYHDLHRQGIIPDPTDIQFFGGFGQYIENGLKKMPMKTFFWEDYYLQMMLFNLFGEWVFPYWELDYVQTIANYEDCYNRRAGRICDQINREILPQGIANVRNPKTRHVIAAGYRTISAAILKRIQDEYDSSWYGRRYPMKMTPHIVYSNTWGAYNEAAICEHLINKGYKINDKKESFGHGVRGVHRITHSRRGPAPWTRGYRD